MMDSGGVSDITYATKGWRDDIRAVLGRHPTADLVIGNNLGFDFVDIGATDQPYYLPELSAVQNCKTKYIAWYAGDVVPPAEDWWPEAVALLDKHPIVTCNPWDENVQVDRLYAQGDFPLIKTDFGWLSQSFSDQCYLSTTEFMQSIDYNTDHPIARLYPAHGGNSFERRVAQYLANHNLYMAILKQYHYKHIDRRDK